jgi:transcriptional regulator GlxA family with amidase domain
MPSAIVLVVLFDDVQSLDVAGPVDVFAGASRYLTARGERGYQVLTASLGGGPVRTTAGLRLTPDLDLADAPSPQTLVVPGGDGTRHGGRGLADWLRANAGRAQRLVSVCTGAFLLAEAGLLDGRRATTHWRYCDSLARRHPEVTVEPDPIFIQDGDVTTSAGVTAGIDLALALVEADHGRDTALAVARDLVMFLRRPGGQAQFSTQLAAQTAQRPTLRDVQHWIAANPAADLSVEALARRSNLSARQFARAFRAEVGVAPGRYVDQVRLEAARRTLEDTEAGVEQVARQCGYGTPEAMRRAFVRELGVPPSDYRSRF